MSESQSSDTSREFYVNCFVIRQTQKKLEYAAIVKIQHPCNVTLSLSYFITLNITGSYFHMDIIF